LALDARRAAEPIGVVRFSDGRAPILKRGDAEVVAQSGETALCAANNPCEHAPASGAAAPRGAGNARPPITPIWLRDQRTRPPPPPLGERGVFWPRAVILLIACVVTALLFYCFPLQTLFSPDRQAVVAAWSPPAPPIAAGSPTQHRLETPDGLRPSMTEPESTPAQQDAAREPETAPSPSPRSPAARPDAAQGGSSPQPEPASVPRTKTTNLQDVKLLIDRGKQFFENGDLISARILFTRAANAGDAAAAVAMGTTYDPIVLAERGVRGVPADLVKARSWYERAEAMGSPEGPQRLEMLANR
jgi:hypothetical protein